MFSSASLWCIMIRNRDVHLWSFWTKVSSATFNNFQLLCKEEKWSGIYMQVGILLLAYIYTVKKDRIAINTFLHLNCIWQLWDCTFFSGALFISLGKTRFSISHSDLILRTIYFPNSRENKLKAKIRKKKLTVLQRLCKNSSKLFIFFLFTCFQE